MVSDMGLVMRIRPGARVWGLSVWRETVYSGETATTTMSCTNPNPEVPLWSTDPVFDSFVGVCLEGEGIADVSG